MNVKQSKGINLTMLILHLYACMYSTIHVADLYPLFEIIESPSNCTVSINVYVVYSVFIFVLQSLFVLIFCQKLLFKIIVILMVTGSLFPYHG